MLSCGVSVIITHQGGGIYVGATVTMTKCTVSGNTAGDTYGGGIFVGVGGTVTMTECTVSGNHAVSSLSLRLPA